MKKYTKDITPRDENYKAHGYWVRYISPSYLNGEEVLWFKGNYHHGKAIGLWVDRNLGFTRRNDPYDTTYYIQ